MDRLPIDSLHERHPGLTAALALSLAEAAWVCFSRFHSPPVSIKVTFGSVERSHLVDFPVPDMRTQSAHANTTDATEAGAYAVSLATVDQVKGYVAVRRAETRTGADWYVAPPGTLADDLEKLIRLEVGGRNGSRGEVLRYLRQKIDQTKDGESNLPAMAIVVGFMILEVLVADVEDQQ